MPRSRQFPRQSPAGRFIRRGCRDYFFLPRLSLASAAARARGRAVLGSCDPRLALPMLDIDEFRTAAIAQDGVEEHVEETQYHGPE